MTKTTTLYKANFNTNDKTNLVSSCDKPYDFYGIYMFKFVDGSTNKWNEAEALDHGVIKMGTAMEASYQEALYIC